MRPTRFAPAPVLPLLGLLAGLLPAGLHGQDVPLTLETPVPAGVSYDPAIPTPQEVLGHLIGEKHTFPHEVVRYFEAVAAASDRVELAEHGRTHGGAGSSTPSWARRTDWPASKRSGRPTSASPTRRRR